MKRSSLKYGEDRQMRIGVINFVCLLQWMGDEGLGK